MTDLHAERWDGEHAAVSFDRPTAAWIIVALHSTRLGPATGGTRLREYPSFSAGLRDAFALSRAMTWKFAAADFPRGGGKAVLALSRVLHPDERAGLLRRYGEVVAGLAGRFHTGPDVGTGPPDMDLIARAAGPFVHSRTPEAGGAGDSGPWTALGVFSGMEAACQAQFGTSTLDGRMVVVQGAGNAGGPLIELLLAAGAQVTVADADPTVAARWRADGRVRVVSSANVLDAPCDILAPCALGGVLDQTSVERLRCRAVVGAANNQLADPQVAVRLQARAIVYAPDFVVNSGGAVAITGMEGLGWSRAQAEAHVRATGARVHAVLTRASAEGIDPHRAALRTAAERLRAREWPPGGREGAHPSRRIPPAAT